MAERTRVRAALRELGYGVPPQQANFVWLPLGERDRRVGRGCEERGVIVRAVRRPGGAGHDRHPEENDRFLAAAEAAR